LLLATLVKYFGKLLLINDMLNSNERIQWIDITKGLFLVLVCFTHFGFRPDAVVYLTRVTGDIRMPGFFILSGMLFSTSKHHNFKSFLTSKTKSLLLPYLLFFLLFSILDWNLYIHPILFLKSITLNLLYGQGPPKAQPLWFILTLFFQFVLYYLINAKIVNVKVKLLTLFAISLLGYFCFIFGVQLILKLEVVFSSILFFGLGHAFKTRIIHFIDTINTKNIWLILFTIFICFTISRTSSFFNPDAVLSKNRINNYILFNISALFGTFYVLLIMATVSQYSQNVKPIRKLLNIFRYIAQNALPLLAAHCYVLFIVEAVVEKSHLPISPLIVFLIKCVILLLSMYIVIIPFYFNQLYFFSGTRKRSYKDVLKIN
jgi:acyltransferase